MTDLVAQALATPGLVWLVATFAVAGLVRGFSGFGTALIFVPVAGIFLPPERVIAVMMLTDLAGAGALVPRAWPQGDRAEVGLLVLAAAVTVPAGLWLLTQIDAGAIRWIVAAIASGTLVALLTGWRFHGHPGRAGLLGIGAMAGIAGGLTGLTGPAVILFYLAGQNAAQKVRANTILFLAALDVVIVANLALSGGLDGPLFVLALLLAGPYVLTSRIGQALFDPSHERLYRGLAYVVIALAVLRGLPVWG